MKIVRIEGGNLVYECYFCNHSVIVDMSDPESRQGICRRRICHDKYEQTRFNKSGYSACRQYARNIKREIGSLISGNRRRRCVLKWTGHQLWRLPEMICLGDVVATIPIKNKIEQVLVSRGHLFTSVAYQLDQIAKDPGARVKTRGAPN